MKEWIRDAGLPDALSGHGLRKAAARRLAERGASAMEIGAITGHRTLSIIDHYARARDREKLAARAMEKLNPRVSASVETPSKKQAFLPALTTKNEEWRARRDSNS